MTGCKPRPVDVLGACVSVDDEPVKVGRRAGNVAQEPAVGCVHLKTWIGPEDRKTLAHAAFDADVDLTRRTDCDVAVHAADFRPIGGQPQPLLVGHIVHADGRSRALRGQPGRRERDSEQGEQSCTHHHTSLTAKASTRWREPALSINLHAPVTVHLTLKGIPARETRQSRREALSGPLTAPSVAESDLVGSSVTIIEPREGPIRVFG